MSGLEDEWVFMKSQPKLVKEDYKASVWVESIILLLWNFKHIYAYVSAFCCDFTYLSKMGFYCFGVYWLVVKEYFKMALIRLKLSLCMGQSSVIFEQILCVSLLMGSILVIMFSFFIASSISKLDYNFQLKCQKQ